MLKQSSDAPSQGHRCSQEQVQIWGNASVFHQNNLAGTSPRPFHRDCRHKINWFYCFLLKTRFFVQKNNSKKPYENSSFMTYLSPLAVRMPTRGSSPLLPSRPNSDTSWLKLFLLATAKLSVLPWSRKLLATFITLQRHEDYQNTLNTCASFK